MAGHHTPRRTLQRSPHRRNRIAVALLVTVGGLGATWYCSRPSVTLDERDYAIAVALYRVCNLQSTRGLAQVESLLQQPRESIQATARHPDQLHAIIDQARSGNWDSAMMACRALLDGQVKR